MSKSKKSMSSNRSLIFRMDNLFNTRPKEPFSLFSHNKTTDLTKFSSCKNGSDISRQPDFAGSLELNSICKALRSVQYKTKNFLNAISMLILNNLIKNMNIADIRKEYTLKSLELEDVGDSPIPYFLIWLEEAIKSAALEVNAMNLSTINFKNRPSSRTVLLKGVDHGFVFYTNYDSRKGQELGKNPFAALTFFWPELERQVRIEGWVEKVSKELSDTYYLSRPLNGQVGAWASPQSQPIPDREFLENRVKASLE